jgi:heme-degrading monooxygenase HmoA
MFVVVNTIHASPEELDRIDRAFHETAGDMRAFEGFLGLELWRNDEGLLAVSRWTSRDAFLAYPRSDAFRKHHKRMSHAEAIHAAQIKTYEAEELVGAAGAQTPDLSGA